MKLYDFQERVLQQTADQNRVAYYLDMGLGKTFVGAEKVFRLQPSCTLVICQKSKVQDWIEHFKQNYNPFMYDLTKKKEYENFFAHADLFAPRVGVINYELAFRRPDLLQMHGFTLMLDESSLITNENAKRSRFILKMDPQNVILLSGTPTSGKYEKLWSQCKLLGWNISKDLFWKSYVDEQWRETADGFKERFISGYKHVEHLKRKLGQHGAIFMKTNEVMTLPDQVEQKIYVDPSADYKMFRKNRYLMMKDGTELVGDNSLTKILYSRQLCGQYSTAKLEAFKDLLESTEDRMIVFYCYTAELDAMKGIAYDLERPVSVLNGSEHDLNAYESESNSVTFIQYQAGAMGGNFQKANKVIYFDLPLGKGSCDMWEQSKKRIHRIGQKCTCFYYYLLTRDSIEIWNLKALKEGRDFTNALFEKCDS